MIQTKDLECLKSLEKEEHSWRTYTTHLHSFYETTVIMIVWFCKRRHIDHESEEKVVECLAGLGGGACGS